MDQWGWGWQALHMEQPGQRLGRGGRPCTWTSGDGGWGSASCSHLVPGLSRVGCIQLEEDGHHWHSSFSCPQVFPVTSSGAPISEYPFVRTGLLGFVGPGGLVFVVGKMDGLMVVSGRRHNADDIVATALAVEPMKFVYRGR